MARMGEKRAQRELEKEQSRLATCQKAVGSALKQMHEVLKSRNGMSENSSPTPSISISRMLSPRSPQERAVPGKTKEEAVRDTIASELIQLHPELLKKATSRLLLEIDIPCYPNLSDIGRGHPPGV